MNIFIILPILILFCFLAYFRFNFAIYLTLALLPAYLFRFSVGPIPFTILESFILILFVGHLIKDKPWERFSLSKEFKKTKKNYPYYLEIILILLAAWLSLFFVNFNQAALGIFKAYFLEPIMLFIVLINNRPKSLSSFIWPLSLSALFLSIIAIYQKISGQFIPNEFWAISSQRRVSSVFSYPNALGLFLGPIIPLSLAMILNTLKLKFKKLKSKKEKNLELLKLAILSLSLIGSILSIIFARSFGAMVAILISLFIFSLIYGKLGRIISLSLAGLGLLVLFILNSGATGIYKKLSFQDLSGQIRKQQWKETVEMLKDGKILIGSGLNNYQVAVEPYHQEGIFVKNDDPDWYRKVVWDDEYKKKVWQPLEIYLYPHNIFLNFWTELGLLGLLVFIFLITRFLIDSYKLYFYNKKEFKGSKEQFKTKENAIFSLSLFSAMIIVFIHGLVDVPYFKNDLSALFWILISLLGIIKIEKDLLQIKAKEDKKI